MAKTKITTVRAKNQITGEIKWFTEATWKRLGGMPRQYKGKTYPHQGWVRIAEKKAVEPDAAKEAAAAKAKAAADAKALAEAEAEAKAKADADKAEALAKAQAAAKEANAPKTAPQKSK